MMNTKRQVHQHENRCEHELYACGRCSIGSGNVLQCDECMYGLILATSPYNHCIQDCSEISVEYVTNYFTQSCEYWGKHCTKCNLLTGWTDSPMIDNGYKLELASGHQSPLFKELVPCDDSRCKSCSSVETSSQCDVCYSDVSLSTPCDLCDHATDSNCLQCDPLNSGTCLSCKEGFSLAPNIDEWTTDCDAYPEEGTCTECEIEGWSSCSWTIEAVVGPPGCIWCDDGVIDINGVWWESGILTTANECCPSGILDGDGNWVICEGGILDEFFNCIPCSGFITLINTWVECNPGESLNLTHECVIWSGTVDENNYCIEDDGTSGVRNLEDGSDSSIPFEKCSITYVYTETCNSCLNQYIFNETTGACDEYVCNLYSPDWDEGTCTSCEPDSLTECSVWDEGYFYDETSTTCKLACPEGTYPDITVDENGKIVQKMWMACPEEWSNWVGPNSLDDWLDCSQGQYLLITQQDHYSGGCLSKPTTETLTLNLFVSNNATYINSGTTPDGTLSKPFYDLEDAINYGYEQAAPKASATITIHLWSGTHYLLYSPEWFYQNSQYKDSYNVDVSLVIQPLYWTYTPTGGISISSFCGNSGSKVTIYNKRGRDSSHQFTLTGGPSLTLTDIVFDSIDSVLPLSDSTAIDWLNSRKIWCKITDATGVITNNTIPSSSLWSNYLSVSEQCLYTSYKSFIKMKVSSKQNSISANQLTISNCEFKNFFMNFNALVNTNPYGSRIVISSSYFTHLTSWMNIIKNFNTYLEVSVSEPTDIDTERVQYHNYIASSSVQAQASIYHGDDVSTNPYSAGCSIIQCFYVTISSSYFRYLGLVKSAESSVPIVPEASRYYGMVLNLDRFQGDVTVKGSTFEYNYVKINGWQIVEDLASTTPVENDAYEYASENGTVYQIKSVISIMNHPRLVVIGENTFKYNAGMKGVIAIESTKQKSYPVFILGNTFEENSGFMYSDAIYLRKINDDIYNPDLTSSTHYCTGLYLGYNSFVHNIGCADTTESTVKAYWHSTNVPSTDDYYSSNEYLDHQYMEYKTPGSSDQTKFVSTVNIDGYTASNYTLIYGGTYGNITFNMQKVLLTSNTFTTNYGGKDGAILSLEGFPYVEISSTTFTKNGNNVPDLSKKYSTIEGDIQTVSSSSSTLFASNTVNDTFLAAYDQKMKTILNIDMSNKLVLTSLTFTNNWIIDTGVSSPASHSMLISNVYKAFSCTNWVFTTHKGIAGDSEMSTLATLTSVTQAMTVDLIKFDRYFFNTFSISGSSSFTYNIMSGSRLFQIGTSGTLQTVNSLYTTATLTMTVSYNVGISSGSLFLPYVKTFTCTTWSFSYNGYNYQGGATPLMNYIVAVEVLDGHSFTFTSCLFNYNYALIAPLIVTDQSSISYSGTPSSTNFFISSTNFTNNIASSDTGSFKIMNNPWIRASISSVRFVYNYGPKQLNNYIGNIYSITFTSWVYSTFEAGDLSAITASVLEKTYPYYLTMTSTTITCSYSGIVDATLKTNLTNNQKSAFTKPTLFVLSSSSTSTFYGNTVSSCKGMSDGGIFRVTQGTLIETGASYSSLIVYQGAVYYLGAEATITSTNVNLTSSFAYRGAFIYSTTDDNTFSITTSTISSNTLYRRGIFYFESNTVATVSAATISSNTCPEATVLYCANECDFTINGSSKIQSNTATGSYVIFYVLNSVVDITSTTVSSNKANQYLTMGISESEITITSSTFSSNNVTQRWGGIWASDTTSVTINHSSFNDNVIGERAVLDILAGSSLSMTNSTFEGNEANQNSVIMYLNDVNTATINNWTFRENVSKGGGNPLSFIFTNKVEISDSFFYANHATQESNHIYCIFTEMEIDNWVFDDSSYDSDDIYDITGGFMYLSTSSVVSIADSTFTSGHAIYGGAIYILGNAEVSIESSTFTNNEANQGAAIHATTYKTFSISNGCKFAGNSASSRVGECIYVSNAFSTLTISSSEFNVSNNAIYLQRTDVDVDNCTFLGISSTVNSLNRYAGGIEFDQVEIGTITSSSFTSLIGLGGALKISSNAFFKEESDYVTYTIKDTTIKDCISVQDGGGIYIDTIKEVTLENTVISNCTADSGEGGGIYFICYENSHDHCSLNLINTTVSDNAAKIGGGIKWNYREPSADSDSYVQNNTASLYGVDYACFAQEIKLLDEAEYQYYTNSSNDLSATWEGSQSESLTSLSFSGVMSGGSIPTTYLALVDQYDQIVTSDSASLCEFIVDETSGSGGQFTSEVYGQTKFYPLYGVYNISGLYLVADPDSDQALNLYNYGIDVSIPIVAKFLKRLFGYSMEDDYVLPMGVGVRPCLEGEGLRENGACYEWPKGTYLLEVPTTPTEWKECNTERAICLGGSNIGPREGYWRKSNLTEEFQVCPVSDACLGMTAPDYNPKGDWADGYHGTVCQGCLPGYYRVGDDECGPWPNQLMNFVKIVGMMLASIVLIVIMVRNILASAMKPSPTSVYIKVMMNHLQLIMITASFNFDWPDSIVGFFETVAPVATASDNLISFDCLIDTRPEGSVNLDDNTAPSNEIRVEQKNVMIYWSLPWVLALFIVTAWAIILKKRGKMNKLEPRFVTTYIFIIFIVFPSVTQIMVDQFNCQLYDEELRSRKDLQVY